jgi:hypothetical protein
VLAKFRRGDRRGEERRAVPGALIWQGPHSHPQAKTPNDLCISCTPSCCRPHNPAFASVLQPSPSNRSASRPASVHRAAAPRRVRRWRPRRRFLSPLTPRSIQPPSWLIP